MVEIIKTCTSYNVRNASKSMRVEGSAQVCDGAVILNLHLNFFNGETQVGSVSYAEYDNRISCNYDYSDASIRAEIEQATGEIIAELKQCQNI